MTISGFEQFSPYSLTRIKSNPATKPKHLVIDP